MIKVYLVQIDSAKGNKSENIARAKKLILDASPAEGSLVILPEMFATGYPPENLETSAEDFSSSSAGETARMLSEVSSATGCTVMGAGITSINGFFYNHASIYEPQKSKESCGYNKINLFFPEKENFKAGEKINLFNKKETLAGTATEQGAKTCMTGPTDSENSRENCSWKIASFICYDLRFPEIFREATKQGANLITIQAAWPAMRLSHWETLLKARAIENQVYIAAVNAVSTRPDQKAPLAGSSLILSPTGDILAQGPTHSETVISTELDLQAEKDYRKIFPVLDGIVPRELI